MSKIFVKICGITNPEDALFAVEKGADAIGFIFAEQSPRKVDVETAVNIAKDIPSKVNRVGVFVEQEIDFVNRIVKDVGLNYVQLHGDEDMEYCGEIDSKIIKAFRIKDTADVEKMANFTVDIFLLDTFVEDKLGGTGRTFDWNLAVEAKRYGIPIILSGGLNPNNVAEAIKKVQPFGVDVSSGVEKRPGKKDHEKIVEFMEKVRGM